jgi:hypothetical protein
MERNRGAAFEPDGSQPGTQVVAPRAAFGSDVEAEAIPFDPRDIAKRSRLAGLIRDVVVEREQIGLRFRREDDLPLHFLAAFIRAA